ncbi:hypothetical protein HC024_10545 [Methylococcaceae bacterium WWC4]|nr:hypothetical protein [Methylococcaceae bacterium WWC4]
MNDEKQLSTTQLAKLRGIAQEQMFGQLTALGLIEKKRRQMATDQRRKCRRWRLS